MVARDGAERQRIAVLQGEALADRAQAMQSIALLKRRLRDLNDDYVLTGCDALFGSLDHPSSFNFR